MKFRHKKRQFLLSRIFNLYTIICNFPPLFSFNNITHLLLWVFYIYFFVLLQTFHKIHFDLIFTQTRAISQQDERYKINIYIEPSSYLSVCHLNRPYTPYYYIKSHSIANFFILFYCKKFCLFYFLLFIFCSNP